GICKYAGHHVLLVGSPGSGKSTALARLLLQEAENALEDQQAKIPVLVELRYLPSEANESSVCDRILAFMHKHDPSLDIDEARIKKLLRQGRLLLLVDGVNELPSDRGRVMVNQFRELYQKTCPMIFTTRELSAGGDLGIAKRLEMQPLTEPQMEQFVMAYLPTQGERLLRQLSGRLREFGQTPLLLWMLCSLFQQSEQIPPNLGMVFRAFTVVYGDRIKQDVTLSKDSRAWWGRLLQYLAFKMTCCENLTDAQVAISRREAEQILVKFLRGKVEFADDCAVRWLEDLLKHHLIQISNDRIEFRHQLIQEYYAAEWLLRLLPSLSDARLQHDYLNYLKWTEPLALMLELVESEEQAVRVVKLALEVDLQLGGRLAGAVRYGFQEKTVELLMREIDERKIPKLYAIKLFGKTRSDYAIKPIIKSLKDEDSNVRLKASRALGEMGNKKAVESLMQLLEDVDFFVRIDGARSLGKIGIEIADEHLIEISVKYLIQSLKIRRFKLCINIEKALIDIRSDKALDVLIQALQYEESSMYSHIARVLGEIGNTKAVEPLIQTLKKGGDADTVRAVVWALDNIGGIDRAIQTLIQAIKYRNCDVHWNAAEILAKIDSNKTVNPLIQALKDEDIYLRWSVVEMLGDIGSEISVKPLVQALKDEDFFVRLSVVEALGKIGNEKAIEHFIQELKNSNTDVRLAVIEALCKFNSEKTVEPLLQFLNDDDVQVNVIRALGRIGSKKAIKPLLQLLEYSHADTWKNVIEALGKIGSEKAVEPLLQVLKNGHTDVQGTVIGALGEIGSEKAVEPLLQVLKTHDSILLCNVADALGKIGSEKADRSLIQLLGNKDIFVRLSGIEALGKIGSEIAVRSLIQLLRNGDSVLQANIVEVLGKTGSNKVFEFFLESLLVCDDVYLRRTLVEALIKIDSKKVVNFLIQDLKHEDSYVRRYALKALTEIDNENEKVVEAVILSLKDKNVYVRRGSVNALMKIDSKKVVEALILSLKDEDSYIRSSAEQSLVQLVKADHNLTTLTQRLPHLLTLILTESSQEALSVITAIQSQCKYYNYDIAQTPLPP
ncbi:MAG: HEAT repeat domain-containing protein, partial [Pseudanabaena sp.]